MEKTDRELLIKEISSRLPYGIKAQVFGWNEEKGEVAIPLKVYSINTDGYLSFEYNRYSVEIVYVEECRLYLRPMSSMTEEEEKEFGKIFELELKAIEAPEGHTIVSAASSTFEIDFYNKHHLDYRGLIEKGLAIEAPEGMYETEKQKD